MNVGKRLHWNLEGMGCFTVLFEMTCGCRGVAAAFVAARPAATETMKEQQLYTAQALRAHAQVDGKLKLKLCQHRPQTAQEHYSSTAYSTQEPFQEMPRASLRLPSSPKVSLTWEKSHIKNKAAPRPAPLAPPPPAEQGARLTT